LRHIAITNGRLLVFWWFIVFDRRWYFASKNSQAPLCIYLLHALLLSFFGGLCGGFIATNTGDVVGIVNVPRLLS
jgi:hypothetical protein